MPRSYAIAIFRYQDYPGNIPVLPVVKGISIGFKDTSRWQQSLRLPLQRQCSRPGYAGYKYSGRRGVKRLVARHGATPLQSGR